MKRLSLLVASLLLTFAFVIPSFAFAQEHDQEQNIIVAKDDVINNDYFAGGDNVTVLGTINGDAYVAGGNVTFDGTVTGDIIAAGGNVVIKGTAQNVRVAGGQVTISGVVERNVTAMGGNIAITDGAQIAGSVVAGGGTITLGGQIGKGATLGGGTITFEDTIHGDINVAGGQVIFQPDARVDGNVMYTSDEKAQVMPGASISGKLAHTIPPKEREHKNDMAELFGFGFLAGKLMESISLLVIGLLLVFLAPRYVTRIANGIAAQPWKSMGIGLLALIVTPVIVMILFATVLGIPLAIVLAILFGLVLYLSKLFVMYLIGEKVSVTFGKTVHPALVLCVGLIVYQIISLIPFVGGLMEFAAVLAGIGGLLLQKKQMYTSLRKQKKV